MSMSLHWKRAVPRGCQSVLTVVGLCIPLMSTSAVLAQPTSPAPMFPLRAIHASGNWGTNEEVVWEWEDADRSNPLVPGEYLAWLERLYVNWIGLSVALTYDDSMDSTVDRRITEYLTDGGSFSDAALRQMIREFRSRGIDVYLTLAFEAWEAETAARPVRRWELGDPGCCHSGILPEHWPWRPDHPDHERFVAEFWETYTQQAVHVGTLAEEEGVRMYSLGTETDRLFRTRSGGELVNDFGRELQSMVERVRAVYSGLLTYDMHYSVLLEPEYYGPGTGSGQLWNDLDLDVVGISAWFPLTDAPPSTVTSVEEAQATYEQIINDHLAPLAARNPDRPIMFLEYGAMDLVETPAQPADTVEFPMFIFDDANGNGIDDGRETQANLYRGLFNAMNSNPGLLNGAFLWDNWITSEETWEGFWEHRRAFAVRNKPSEEIVQAAYAPSASNGPPEPVGTIPTQTVGPVPLAINVEPYFLDPEGNRLTYVARSSDANVARVSMTGAVLEVTAVAVGETTIAVTATDGRGWATQTFRVNLSARALPIRPFSEDCQSGDFRDGVSQQLRSAVRRFGRPATSRAARVRAGRLRRPAATTRAPAPRAGGQ